jgi:hypothetical protein
MKGIRFTGALAALSLAVFSLTATSAGAVDSHVSAKRSVVSISRFQSAWCKLSPGEFRQAVKPSLGDPHGTKASAALKAKSQRTHETYSEWDQGNDIFVIIYHGPFIGSLDAYSGHVGAVGAKGIKCAPLRQ